MSETITLKEYRPSLGFGVFAASSDNNGYFLIDMHIDGTTEPFASWAQDTTTPIEEMDARCKALEGKTFEVARLASIMFYAENGKML